MKTIMNLNAYDNVIEPLDKRKTWVDIRKKQLISRELSRRTYCCLLKRYDPQTNSHSFYVALLDNPPQDRKYKYVITDCYGRIKISLASIWQETYLCRLEHDCNISIGLVEHEEDGDVYLLDI